MVAVRACFVSLLLILPCGGNSSAASERDIADKARNSVVYIYFDAVASATGAKTAIQGTGVVVSQNYVLTAAHLFRDWLAETSVDRAQNPIRGTIRDRPGYVSQSPLILEMVSIGNPDAEDVAVLKLPDAAPGENRAIAPICLAKARAARLGDTFTAYGFPLGQSLQPVPGILGAQNAPGGRWQATAAFSHGMSGGPVYSADGHVIGVVKGGLGDDAAARWVTPIQYAENFLRIAGWHESCDELANGQVDRHRQGRPEQPACKPGWIVTRGGQERGGGRFDAVSDVAFHVDTPGAIDITPSFPANMSGRNVFILMKATTTHRVPAPGLWSYDIEATSSCAAQYEPVQLKSDGIPVPLAMRTPPPGTLTPEQAGKLRPIPRFTVEQDAGAHTLEIVLKCYILQGRFPVLTIKVTEPNANAARPPRPDEFCASE